MKAPQWIEHTYTYTYIENDEFDFHGLGRVHEVDVLWYKGLDAIDCAKPCLECCSGTLNLVLVQTPLEIGPSLNGRAIIIASCVWV